MPCNQFRNTRCNDCSKFLKSSSTAQGAGDILIEVPSIPFNNGSRACLCIAQNMPATAVPSDTVSIVISSNGLFTEYPLYTRCGNRVHSDQLKARKVYHIRAVTDIPGFVVTDCLCKTAFTFPTIPETPAIRRENDMANQISLEDDKAAKKAK